MKWLQRRSNVPDVPAPDPAEVARLAAILETWPQEKLEALAEQIRGHMGKILASVEEVMEEEE